MTRLAGSFLTFKESKGVRGKKLRGERVMKKIIAFLVGFILSVGSYAFLLWVIDEKSPKDDLHSIVAETDVEHVVIDFYDEGVFVYQEIFEKGESYLAHIIASFNELEVVKEFDLEETKQQRKVLSLIMLLTDGSVIEVEVYGNKKTLIIQDSKEAEEGIIYQTNAEPLLDLFY